MLAKIGPLASDSAEFEQSRPMSTKLLLVVDILASRHVLCRPVVHAVSAVIVSRW